MNDTAPLEKQDLRRIEHLLEAILAELKKQRVVSRSIGGAATDTSEILNSETASPQFRQAIAKLSKPSEQPR